MYELVAHGRTVGWLYGAVHYGTFESPSLSQAAARAITRTRHIYLEHTDRAGSSWAMRNALAPDLEATARAKRDAATASADRVRQGIIAAKRLEKESGGVALVLASDAYYYDAWDLAHQYCGAFLEYGTERLALALASGFDITVHSLETEASRQTALDAAREPRCRPRQTPTPSAAPVPESMDEICRMILHDVARDQHEGRPVSLTAAAVCVADSRHRTMAARIARAARAGEKPFVVVGGGHLMPGQNLVALLEGQGLTLRRVD